jgi:hypothetical protein
MTKLYVSKIDNKTFNTESELIAHLKNNYSMIDETGGESANILRQLQSAFPFAKINVTESSETRYGSHVCSMHWDEYDADFTFYIGKHHDFDYYYMSFDNVEQAIKYYQNYLDYKDQIIEKLKEVYDPEKIEIGQMYEGGSDSNNSILFIMHINGNEYSEHFEFGDIDMFINSFKGYFDTVIEGDVVIERNYSSGYDREPKINGVGINTILNRAKKIRIEILETK